MREKNRLNAAIRETMGTAHARRLRRLAGGVPAVVYGGGRPQALIVLEAHRVNKALSIASFHTQIIDLDVGGTQEQVVLKAVQYHPTKPEAVHLDFLRVRADTELTLNVPLHFTGSEDAPGTKVGGVFSHNLSEVEVRCQADSLPESITVDVSPLEMDGVVHLSDLVLPKGVSLVAFTHGVEDHDLPVASIHKPRVQAEPEEGEGPAEDASTEASADSDQE